VDHVGLKVVSRGQFDENSNPDTLIIGRSAWERMASEPQQAFEVVQ
jgi:hypothetical protein